MAIGRAAEILSALVGFDTTSYKSNLPLIQWVEDYLDGHGVPHERVYDATGQKANLWATLGPVDRPGYILSGHTDVVPVDGQDWSSDPFQMMERAGRFYGRGTSDMKGYLACCLALVPDMLDAPLATPVHLAFSYDEEVGCVGVRGLIDRLRQAEVRPLGCIVGEPTEMQVIIGHKAKRSVRVTVRGAGGHSSLAPQAVNAVEYLAAFVARVQKLARSLEREGNQDSLYDIAHTTAHVGTFNGGRALNIVPDSAEAVFEIRAITGDDPDALLAQLIAYAREELEPAMQSVNPDTGFSFDVYAAFPGLDIAPDEHFVTIAKALAGRNDHAKVAYGTEAGLFQSIGIPTVVMGPGSIGQAHKPDEWIAISEMEKCLGTLGRLIERCRA